MAPLLLPHSGPPMWGGAEFGYSLIVAAFCLLIFFQTKGMFDLTRYKGIKYFRNAFLLLGLAYAARLFFGIFMLSNKALGIFVPMHGPPPYLLVIAGYLSTMAIFYLIYSTMWKKIAEDHFLMVANISAVVLTVATMIHRSPLVLGILQLVLLLVAVIVNFISDPKNKKVSQIRVLYLLVLVFWLLDVAILGPRRFLPFGVRVLFQVFSLGVFLVMYYKVRKWVR